MVVIFAPLQSATNVVQLLTEFPFKCTTQAPHCDVSHPTCVPVNANLSLKKSNKNLIFESLLFPKLVLIHPGLIA